MSDKERKEIILIGPACVGKSTIAQLLSEVLKIPNIDLDHIAEKYYQENGFGSDKFSKVNQEFGFLTAYRQWWSSLAYAVERVIDEHHNCVISLGAGHSHYEDKALFNRVQNVLKPFTNVVLLLPSPNLDLSVQILRERSLSQRGIHWKPKGYDFFEHWIKDECNHELSTLTIYTEGKSPEQTRDEIMKCIHL